MGEWVRNLDNFVDLILWSLTANEEVMLEHFLLEDAMSKPYHHRDNIRLENSGFDRDTNFTWCQFYRPIRESISQCGSEAAV